MHVMYCPCFSHVVYCPCFSHQLRTSFGPSSAASPINRLPNPSLRSPEHAGQGQRGHHQGSITVLCDGKTLVCLVYRTFTSWANRSCAEHGTYLAHWRDITPQPLLSRRLSIWGILPQHIIQKRTKKTITFLCVPKIPSVLQLFCIVNNIVWEYN